MERKKLELNDKSNDTPEADVCATEDASEKLLEERGTRGIVWVSLAFSAINSGGWSGSRRWPVRQRTSSGLDQLFGRRGELRGLVEDSNLSHRTSVHKAVGGGRVADLLLWRRWCSGAMLLVSATTMYYLFEIAGYDFLPFVANVLLLFVVILFFWAKSASLLNRPLPPIPNMEISERTIGMVSDELHGWINCVLAIAHDITIGRNLKLFIKVAVGLWFVSFIGSLVNFLTLVYIGVIFILSVPLVYDKFQHQIDEKLSVADRTIQEQFRKIDETVLSRLPFFSNKEKKMQ
ncbi:reticulon-like protein B10 [Hibiscus syriacus]|uniref:reticulon-like protein B10 n=1 Tax=Hibiscus syriacus TaxID=106335 RepID=UPI00192401F0|nr:reticulon-like protein B10 [Hibiscus syriacus]